MGGELSRITARALKGHRLARPDKLGQGILLYPFDPKVAQVAVDYHRTSSRVLMDLYESSKLRLEPLYDELRRDVETDDRKWGADGSTFSIRARNLHDYPAGPRQVVGAVKNALIDGAASRGIRLRVQPENPDLHVAVRMHDKTVSVSLDLAGRAMHQRGYRVESTEAPLRENLAAVLVMLSRFDARTETLVDPMVGSGTIAIEAALMATGEPLWTQTPAYRAIPLMAGLEPTGGPLFPGTAPRIFASDIDSRAIEAARENARAAGVADRIAFHHCDMRHLSRKIIESQLGALQGSMVVLSNPPYGERLVAGDEFYGELGRAVRGLGAQRAAFLVANPEFEPAYGGRARIRKPLANANLRSYFLLYDQ
jgi:23S rRNA G2445 N2-methylase RlmL